MNIKFAPGNFFVWHGPAIASIAGSAVAYLAEITPERYLMHFQILVHHRHHAYRKIAGYATANLEETNALSRAVMFVPIA